MEEEFEREFLNCVRVKSMLGFKLPKWEEIPDIGLYIEQVINYVDKVFELPNIEKKIIITKTMINNYVKQKIIIAPVNKKYYRDSIASLIYLCLLKPAFSIIEIGKLFGSKNDEYDSQAAYDYFTEEVEESIKSVFLRKERKNTDRKHIALKCKTSEFSIEIVHSLAAILSHKIYIDLLGKFYFEKYGKHIILE